MTLLANLQLVFMGQVTEPSGGKQLRSGNKFEQYSTEELSFAAEMKYRASGHLDAAKVLKDIGQGSPSRASSYRSSVTSIRGIPMNGDEAVAFIIQNELSRRQYENTRANAIKRNYYLYPSYHIVSEAKKRCYLEGIFISKTCAEIKLQNLLNHTASRLILTQSDVLKSLPYDAVKELYLYCKWGCDGTSGQSTYKQKLSDNDNTVTDSNIFFISLVPLQLYANNKTNQTTIIWKNCRPSAARYCRPIKIAFANETVELTKLEVHNIKEQEENLVPFRGAIDGQPIDIMFKLLFTMIDGKVCNSVTDTKAAQRCYICHATSKEFNNIDVILKKEIKEENLQYGMSSLHAWIRFFECLIKLSYRV
jgi:hypothetical protein